MASAPFWIAMICQIIIVIGYFWFYRKEQLGTSLSNRRVYLSLIVRLQPDHDHDLAVNGLLDLNGLYIISWGTLSQRTGL